MLYLNVYTIDVVQESTTLRSFECLMFVLGACLESLTLGAVGIDFENASRILCFQILLKNC